MRIDTLNVAHQTRAPKSVPADLLQTLANLDLDALVLTEFVETPEYREALTLHWPHVETSEQTAKKSGFHNQIGIAANQPMRVLAPLPAVPTHTAQTNHLAVEIGALTLTLTGLRAPAFKVAADRKTYWDSVARHLPSGVVIGDFNLNPERSPKEARMVPDGWRVVTPACGGPSFQSLKNESSSTVDHAFVTPEIKVVAAEYRPEFFGKWKLDHCALILEIRIGD